MRSRFAAAALLAGALGASSPALAFDSNFDASLGFTSLDMIGGQGFDQTMESLTSLEVHYNINFANVNGSLTMLFSELFESNFGQLAYTRFGLGWRWFPFGLNGERKIVDNEVEGRFWNAKPFFEITMGMANISIATNDVQDIDFNAVIIDLAPTLGMEVPIGTNFLLMTLVRYLTSMDSTTATASDPLTAIKYSGFQIMVGARITPF